MRFVVDLSRGEGGRVSVQVAVADAAPTPFSGWLELLRLLEDGADPLDRGDRATGGPAQETTWDG